MEKDDLQSDEQQPMAADLQTESSEILPEPKTEIMEVHHHPDLHHKRKHWKEYFLEFLMIFLAVTLGFFAENLREHFKDRKQMQQYIQSLNQDLKDDVAMYDSSIAINQLNRRMIDTLIFLMQDKKETGRIYVLARKLTLGHGIFTPNNKTFEQLKSTGGFRLFENQKNLDSINNYYQLLKFFDYWSNLQRQRINEVIEGNDKLFDGNVFFAIYKMIDKTGTVDTSLLNSKPAFLTNDPLIVNAIIVHYQYMYGLLTIIDKKAAEASDNASRLSKLLETEYNIN
jgi:hypothetical protein